MYKMRNSTQNKTQTQNTGKRKQTYKTRRRHKNDIKKTKVE